MSKHIVLPTNTSDLDTIKKVLDYLYNNMSVEFNVDDFRNETHYTSGDSHKLAFLDYFSIINRTNGSIEFKLTAQFIYLYWNITEIRNKLLILSWLCSYLPSTWNRTNYPDKKCYIICELFEIILNNKNSDINIIDKKIKDFLSNEKNLVENSNEELEKIEENLDTKLNKILVYFKGILKNLGVLLNNNTSLNLELLENIEVWIDKLRNNNFNIDSLKNIIQSILKDISKEKFEIKTELKSLPYQKIVYGAPGTGKSYSLNQEAKETFKREILLEKFSDEISTKKYWVVTCGENNWAFDEFKRQGIYSIGWEEIKNISKLTYAQLEKEVVEKYNNKFGAIQLNNIAHEMKVGDILLVRIC